MRTMMMLAAIATMTTLMTTMMTPAAEACGGYGPVETGPRVMELTHHAVRDGAERWRTRWFVTLGTSTRDDGLTWRRLERETFDATQIADARELATPMTVTLVGPSGTRVVSSSKVVMVSTPLDRGRMRTALEVEVRGMDWEVAVRGDQAKAAWREIEHRRSTAATRAWAKQRGLDPEHVTRSRVRGMNVEVVSGFIPGSFTQRSIVRDLRSDQPIGPARGGELRGALELAGVRYAVFAERGAISTVAM